MSTSSNCPRFDLRMSYRQLTNTEIKILAEQGCSSVNWDNVQVAGDFDARRVHRCHFSGKIRLGHYAKEIRLSGHIPVLSGLHDSTLHDCTVGNDAYIRQARRISGYDIGPEAIIDNIDEIAVTEKSGFGNGIRINVLNETGGRQLILFDRLTAQIAYLITVYRHEPLLTKRLEGLIDSYVQTRISERGIISSGARIAHCGRIRNINVGPHAEINGALSLEEGTISSCREDPVVIGSGVMANRFIVLSGSRIGGGAHIESCFVGQGVHLGRQFSAESSAFFANCEGDHGEMVSVFAGPHSVSHHKSTLLIASQVSFFNAGSGTNQSNHMYKLGPMHQGVLERGCKTGSSSYLMFPSRIGPFTTIMGKHFTNIDSACFPFSNIAEKHGQSILTPAVNLLTVGTRRDSDKWPARDRRKNPEKLDLIHYQLLNPFTVGRMIEGSKILDRFHRETAKERECVAYKGVNIRRLMLNTGFRYYQIGIKVFLGSCVYKKLRSLAPDADWKAVKSTLTPKDRNTGRWVDLLGLFVPQSRVTRLIGDIIAGAVTDIEALISRLKSLYEGYADDEWAWCVDLLESVLEIRFEELKPCHLRTLMEDWRENSIKFNKMILNDAGKEFNPNSRISYGLDGDAETVQKDFEQIHGTVEENSFVRQILDEITSIEDQSAMILDWLQKY